MSRPTTSPAPTPDVHLAVHGARIATRRRHIGPFDLELRAGELVALVGVNGSGKTTLVRLALGLEPPSSGDVTLLGQRVGPTRAPRGVGAVLDVDGLYPWRTGRQNLALYGALAGVPDRAIDEQLRAVGLAAAADRPVRTYSRGMQQRLSIARALVAGPTLLLLDEPTVALDAEAATWLRDLLEQHVRRGGSALVATHDHAWLAGAATRTVTVDAGATR